MTLLPSHRVPWHHHLDLLRIQNPDKNVKQGKNALIPYRRCLFHPQHPGKDVEEKEKEMTLLPSHRVLRNHHLDSLRLQHPDKNVKQGKNALIPYRRCLLRLQNPGKDVEEKEWMEGHLI